MKPRTLLINALVLIGLLCTLESLSSAYYSLKASRQFALGILAKSIKRRLLPRTAQPDKNKNACTVISNRDIVSSSQPFSDPLYGGYFTPNSLYTTNITLVANPGNHIPSYSWHFRTGPYGNRITSLAQLEKAPSDKKPLVLLLGDSYIFGEGVNDSGSLGWILQTLMPTSHVYNFARGGTGNVHQVIQLKDALTENRLIPKEIFKRLEGGYVLLGYGDYYQMRNVAAPSWLRSMNQWMHCAKYPQKISTITPRANLDASGRSLSFTPVDWLNLNSKSREVDPSADYQEKATILLLTDAINSIRQLKAKPVIGFISGTDHDKVYRWAISNHIKVVDLRPNTQRYDLDNLNPYDGHPGYLAHQTWASRIAEALR